MSLILFKILLAHCVGTNKITFALMKYQFITGTRRKTACPRGFDLIGGGCYKISDERMGWIEAKKMCEATNSQLISFQSKSEAESLISFIRRTNPRRTRFEFWTAGNDIDKENEWIWSGPFREPVGGNFSKL